MKTFHFISGLPRSGSTLLCNILCQNPKFHATSSSGIIDLVTGIRNTWNNIAEFRATPNEESKKDVMLGIFHSFYKRIDKPIIFDKSRGWIAFPELLEEIFDKKVKFIIPVRDLRDILASFEKIWRRDSKSIQIPQEKENFVKFQTIQGRAEVWLSPNQPVGIAYNRIGDAIKRGYRDRMFFVDFDDLTQEPKQTMQKLYEFIEETYFEHDFNEVKQITKEDDSVYGFTDLHTIKSKVEPMRAQWPIILGKEFERFGNMNFWKK